MVGDTLHITVWFDETYRNGPLHPMPDWFTLALQKNGAALNAWEQLPPSRQKEVLRYFHTLKSEVAMARNLERVMRALSGEQTRFMGRDWRDGK
ncbi:MAG TPA: YdeI/OmpD-associated family protein [Candidatus Saccharimonadales bacterium]